MPEQSEENPFSSIPSAPTVEVRTLHGDVQSMSATGGTAMQIEDVSEMIGRKTTPALVPKSGGSLLFKIAVLILTILIAAVIVGFIMSSGLGSSIPILHNFLSRTPSSTTNLAPATYIPSASTTATFDPYADIEDQRFLRIPADASFELTLNREAAETAEDLLTFPQRLELAMKSVPTSAHFIEVNLRKSGEKPADGLLFMSVTGNQIFSNQFYEENFSPNFTAFIYRDARGSWPGYIFKLLPNKNPRLFVSEIQLLEKTSSLTSLFMNSPGTPSGPFMDKERAGLPTREQTYSESGAVLGYAWEDRYFVISTSAQGLEEALRRLQG